MLSLKQLIEKAEDAGACEEHLQRVRHLDDLEAAKEHDLVYYWAYWLWNYAELDDDETRKEVELMICDLRGYAEDMVWRAEHRSQDLHPETIEKLNELGIL